MRSVAPRATLVAGFVPVIGTDTRFPRGFVIKAEKCPNRRGVEEILAHVGGPQATFGDFLAAAGKYRAAYITGGYPGHWLTPDFAAALGRVETTILHDLFASPLSATASIVIPGVSWAERDGTFRNDQGLLQAFERAIPPLHGLKADGQFLHELTGGAGLYQAARVRATLAEAVPAFAQVFEPRPAPVHAH